MKYDVNKNLKTKNYNDVCNVQQEQRVLYIFIPKKWYDVAELLAEKRYH